MLVRLHEGVLHRRRLPKYAAAFFRMSRSSLTRLSSPLSRAISLCSLLAGRPAKSEQSEIARLKGELKRVSEERDILKKAAAYFGKRRR